MRRLREDRGATLVMIVFMFGVFLGIIALVVDLGSWFRSQRSLQTAADAAALAGAQDLPDTANASTSATNYANTNYGSANIGSQTITFAPDNSWIDVKLTTKSLPEVFAKYLHIPAPTASAHARASVGAPGTIKGAVPIVVEQNQVCVTGSTGCFNVQKQLTFREDSLTSSKFGLVDLQDNGDTSKNCNNSNGNAQTLSGWITGGYQAILGINRWYCVAIDGEVSKIGNTVQSVAGINKVLLVPVYQDPPAGVDASGGTNGKGSFKVIGWAAMVIDTVNAWHPENTSCEPPKGTGCKVLTVRFVNYIVHDVVSVPGTSNGFGVKVINLTQ